MTRIVVLGEGMIELSPAAGGGWRLGYGGDTLNTAIHLARLGRDVAFVTALGGGAFSDDLRQAWAGEGVDTRLILTDPRKEPGLYAIRNDASGERTFSYWREASAARGLFSLPGVEAVLEAAQTANLFYYSLISLAILPPEGRDRLHALCRAVRARGGKVAFDGNYRPALWPDAASARQERDRALGVADIGLPTLEDEMALSGAPDADTVASAWSGLGVAETVVKLGARGCRLPSGEVAPPPRPVEPLDTSGAGDAFNAGYLDARLGGQDPAAAALAGHRLAGWVVTQAGAIPARTAEAPYGRQGG
jgi:2-dehydro-3-deoxygluconokinase